MCRCSEPLFIRGLPLGLGCGKILGLAYQHKLGLKFYHDGKLIL